MPQKLDDAGEVAAGIHRVDIFPAPRRPRPMFALIRMARPAQDRRQAGIRRHAGVFVEIIRADGFENHGRSDDMLIQPANRGAFVRRAGLHVREAVKRRRQVRAPVNVLMMAFRVKRHDRKNRAGDDERSQHGEPCAIRERRGERARAFPADEARRNAGNAVSGGNRKQKPRRKIEFENRVHPLIFAALQEVADKNEFAARDNQAGIAEAEPRKAVGMADADAPEQDDCAETGERKREKQRCAIRPADARRGKRNDSQNDNQRAECGLRPPRFLPRRPPCQPRKNHEQKKAEHREKSGQRRGQIPDKADAHPFPRKRGEKRAIQQEADRNDKQDGEHRRERCQPIRLKAGAIPPCLQGGREQQEHHAGREIPTADDRQRADNQGAHRSEGEG